MTDDNNKPKDVNEQSESYWSYLIQYTQCYGQYSVLKAQNTKQMLDYKLKDILIAMKCPKYF